MAVERLKFTCRAKAQFGGHEFRKGPLLPGETGIFGRLGKKHREEVRLLVIESTTSFAD